MGLIALSFLGLAACQAGTAQVPPSNSGSVRTLSVTGEGKVKIPATLTRVRLGVEVQGKTAQEIQKEVAARSRAVVDFLKTQNVEQLQTAGINLNPTYNYANGQQKIVGYTGTNTVSFQIETEKVGNLLDKAVEVGATRIDGVSFKATEDAIEKAQQQAIQEATQAAKTQATSALNSLDLKQKEIVNIAINPTQMPPNPIPYQYNAEVAQSLEERESTTPVEGGEQTISASVMLQVKY